MSAASTDHDHELPPAATDGERDQHGRHGDERPGADELAGAERDPDRPRVARVGEGPDAEPERERREEQGHRLRVEHGGGLDRHRQEGDERRGAELDPWPVRPELARDPRHEQHRSEQEEDVDGHARTVGIADPGLARQPVERAGDRVVPGRRVVLALVLGEQAVRDEPVGVGDVVGRVEARARRVAGDVPGADEEHERADRSEGDPPVSQPASSHRSRPCTCPRRARAASSAGSSGRPAPSGARRTRGRARSAPTTAATRGRGSAPSR